MISIRAQVLCYDDDFLGSADLIGRVVLETDDILAILRASDVTCDGCSCPSLVWMQLAPSGEESSRPTSPNESSPAINGKQNPFDNLGEIALRMTARLPLPTSIKEYNKLGGAQQEYSARDIADAGLEVSGAIFRASISPNEKQLRR